MQPITVIVPYKPGKRLADARNAAVEGAPTEWVLLLDWDLFACTPFWFDMCQYAIEQIGDRTGWISAVTNRIGARQQRAVDCPTSHNMIDHIAYAKDLFRKTSTLDERGILKSTLIEQVPGALSGFFILTNKTAWKKCGGFPLERPFIRQGGDNRYSLALSSVGYKHFRLSGLYYYHIHHAKDKIWKPQGAHYYSCPEQLTG
jgi:GT2 family glycosyltransferase